MEMTGHSATPTPTPSPAPTPTPVPGPGPHYSITVIYNRNNVKAYAKKWYNGVNPTYGSCAGGDCANFVSQCLVAGGIKMTDTWNCSNIFGKMLYSRAWAMAKDLFAYIKRTFIYGTVITINHKSELESKTADTGENL